MKPVFGCVLDSKPSGHVFAPADLIAPGFESELCMRLRADLTAIERRVSINGQQVATGDAVLGTPLNSIVWLAAKLGVYGRILKAGEIVMTGSFTRQFPIAPGDTIETVFSGLGVVGTAMSA